MIFRNNKLKKQIDELAQSIKKEDPRCFDIFFNEYLSGNLTTQRDYDFLYGFWHGWINAKRNKK